MGYKAISRILLPTGAIEAGAPIPDDAEPAVVARLLAAEAIEGDDAADPERGDKTSPAAGPGGADADPIVAAASKRTGGAKK